MARLPSSGYNRWPAWRHPATTDDPPPVIRLQKMARQPAEILPPEILIVPRLCVLLPGLRRGFRPNLETNFGTNLPLYDCTYVFPKSLCTKPPSCPTFLNKTLKYSLTQVRPLRPQKYGHQNYSATFFCTGPSWDILVEFSATWQQCLWLVLVWNKAGDQPGHREISPLRFSCQSLLA